MAGTVVFTEFYYYLKLYNLPCSLFACVYVSVSIFARAYLVTCFWDDKQALK
jgi:hypothetical protein